jgi:hypothetical protein
MLYELTLKVELADEVGNVKEVKERYITDDELFANVELKGLKLYDNECDVCAIKRSKVQEILNTRIYEDECIYNATLAQIFVDENTGKEKEQEYQVLFFAKNLKNATDYILEYVKQGYDMEVKSVKKTSIKEVI